LCAVDGEAVNSYLGAVDWLRGVLGRAEVASAWSQESAIGDYSVGGVAAHAVHSVIWLEQLLKDIEPVGLRLVTIPEFFGLNRAEAVAGADPFSASLHAAAETFAQTGPSMVALACTTARDELVGLLSRSSPERAIPVVRVAGAQVPLTEYLRTRVVEVVVHGDDVVCSVPGMTVANPPPESMETCLSVCLEMARARAGDVQALRAFTRRERALKDVLVVL